MAVIIGNINPIFSPRCGVNVKDAVSANLTKPDRTFLQIGFNMIEYTGIERRVYKANILARKTYDWTKLNIRRASDTPQCAATQPETHIIAPNTAKSDKPPKPTAPPRDTMTPDEIRALRKSLGMTQPEFAEKLGVTVITVSSWERGIRNPSGSAVMLMQQLKTP